MQLLTEADKKCLDAAQGWLGLGNWTEAKAELDSIRPQMREHPAVLSMRWNIHAAAKQWEAAAVVARKLSQLAPQLAFAWIHLAHSLHSLKRTEEARNTLLPLVDRFPRQSFIRYKLACYACQLGHLKEAQHWLQSALEVGDSTEVVKMALQDPDLKPLWLPRPH